MMQAASKKAGAEKEKLSGITRQRRSLSLLPKQALSAISSLMINLTAGTHSEKGF